MNRKQRRAAAAGGHMHVSYGSKCNPEGICDRGCYKSGVFLYALFKGDVDVLDPDNRIPAFFTVGKEEKVVLHVDDAAFHLDMTCNKKEPQTRGELFSVLVAALICEEENGDVLTEKLGFDPSFLIVHHICRNPEQWDDDYIHVIATEAQAHDDDDGEGDELEPEPDVEPAIDLTTVAIQGSC